MPGIVRKLVIFAAVDGLVLQPLAQRNQRTIGPIKISYNSHNIKPLLRNPQDDVGHTGGDTIEVHGIIGVLNVASSAYLIAISQRKQVARIWNKPVYCVTGIAVIPLSSREDARQAIKQAKEDVWTAEEGDDGENTRGNSVDENRSETHSIRTRASMDEETNTRDPSQSGQRAKRQKPSIDERDPGIAEEVINNKGLYGRFTQRWFSKRGWTVGMPGRSQSMSNDPSSDPPETNDNSIAGGEGGARPSNDQAYQRWPQTPVAEKSMEEAVPGVSGQTLTTSLLPKLLSTTKLLFSTGTFFFSYDHDITRSLASQRQASPDLPLYKQVDPEFFWNRSLSTALIGSGHVDYVLPVMQGFIGQRPFSLRPGLVASDVPAAPEGLNPPKDAVEAAVIEPDSGTSTPASTEHSDFILTIISRRSVKRAGLRYLRRGIDEDGSVANAVETEQILSVPSWDPQKKVYSFLQTRGSIPLFFSQMPYTFKPVPQMHATEEANQTALRKHFANLVNRYGALQAVSLVDDHGPEAGLGEAYEEHVKLLNDAGGSNGRTVNFEWFKFHKACKGMKFENVSILVDSMTSFLVASGFTTVEAGQRTTAQSGIIRSNCMDCLDRTNVVQSALAQFVLSQQLSDQGLSVNLSNDPSTMWFNTLWADNGDAISRAYTGTSALKGDYTRTRKRNALGALTDLSLTLTRYYHNLFDDFFAQAAIDFLLGTVNETVFSDFEERMTTADPAIDIDKARQSAITDASHVVVEESEDLLHGWVFLVPAISGTLRTFPFAEALLLLTDKALYTVYFDWEASKVRSFERVELKDIVGLQTGVYITETNTAGQTDTSRNVGLLIKYSPPQSANGNIAQFIRVNTRSLENSVRDAWSVTGSDGHEEDSSNQLRTGDSRTLAFKALRSQPGKSKDISQRMSEQQSIDQVVDELRQAWRKSRHQGNTDQLNVQKKDILSLQDAKRSTGLVESLTYNVKKAIWG